MWDYVRGIPYSGTTSAGCYAASCSGTSIAVSSTNICCSTTSAPTPAIGSTTSVWTYPLTFYLLVFSRIVVLQFVLKREVFLPLLLYKLFSLWTTLFSLATKFMLQFSTICLSSPVHLSFHLPLW